MEGKINIFTRSLTLIQLFLLGLTAICIAGALVALALSWEYFFNMSLSGQWNITGFLFILFFVGLFGLGALCFSYTNLKWEFHQDTIALVITLSIASLSIVIMWGMSTTTVRFSIFSLLLVFLALMFLGIRKLLIAFPSYKGIAMVFPVFSMAALVKLFLYLFYEEGFWLSPTGVNGWLVASYLALAVISGACFWQLRAFFIEKRRRNLFTY